MKMRKKKLKVEPTKWRDCGVGFGDIPTVDFGPTVDFWCSILRILLSRVASPSSLLPLPLVSRPRPLLLRMSLPLCPSGGWPSLSPSPSLLPSPSVSPSPSVLPSPSVSPSPSVLPSPSVSPSFRVPPVVAAVLATRHHGHGSGTSSKLDSGSPSRSQFCYKC